MTQPLLLILSNEIEPAAEPGSFTARHAVRKLMEAGRAAGFAVVAGPFDQFHVELPQSAALPRICAGLREIRPAAAIIRTTTGGGVTMARTLDRALRAQGCVMLDPPDRFDASGLGKAEALLDAQGRGADQDRVIVSSAAELRRRLLAHDYAARGKLVAKPLEGSGGTTVRWVDGSPASVEAVMEVARSFSPAMPPFVIEPALDIAAEYRVYTLDGAVIGAARRVPAGPDRPANASQGAALVEETPPPPVLEAIGRMMRGGLIGWDVALTRPGRTVIIEMNRPPAWMRYDRIGGADIAAAVIARLTERLAQHRRQPRERSQPHGPPGHKSL